MNEEPDKKSHDDNQGSEGRLSHEVPAEKSPSAEAAAERSAKGKGSEKRSRRSLTLVLLLVFAVAASFVLYLGYVTKFRGHLTEQVEKIKATITGKPQPTPDPYAQAVSKVEEDRGEAVGRQAAVEVPSELKQYKEAHRFLAVQAAAAKEAGIKPPRDFPELAAMIEAGQELVEVPKLGRDYVLYGVGLVATGELTHYDGKGERSVPLFADEAELKGFEDKLKDDRARLEAELKELGDKLKAVGKKDKASRSQLNADVKAKKKELGGVNDSDKLVKKFYAAPKGKETLFAEYETLAALARDFGGRSYDLRDAASAKEFQARMLSFARPATLALMEELGAAYQDKFGRPLPVTSLIRTDEYQHRLREAGNPNAIDISVEPHTTGLAFDIFYHFMSASEQEFLMGEIAQLKRDRRVEAIRELRDHYHVFALPGGHMPEEKLIEKLIKEAK